MNTTRGRRAALAVAVAASALTFAAPSPVEAAGECGVIDPLQNVYVGPNGGSWKVAANWSRNQLPGQGNSCVPGGKIVEVPGGTTMVTPIDGQYAVLRIVGTVKAEDPSGVVDLNWAYGGTQMEMTGRLQVSKGVTFNLGPDQAGAVPFRVKPGAVISVGGGAQVRLNRGLVNQGRIALTGANQFFVENGGAISGPGSVTGGTIVQLGGSVTFAGGDMSVDARAGTIRGTINPDSALAIRCDTFSGGVSLDGVTNKGTVRIRPPVAGECALGVDVVAGTTFRNVGIFVVGSATKTLGWGYFSASGGRFVNTGRLNVEDFWTAGFSSLVNSGLISVSPKGVFDRIGGATTNSGRIVSRGGLDFTNFVNSGTIDLSTPIALRGVLTLKPTSKIAVHASRSGVSGITAMSPGSRLDGTLTVITGSRKPGRGWQKPAFAPASNLKGRFDRVKGLIPKTDDRYKVVYKGTASGAVELKVVAR